MFDITRQLYSSMPIFPGDPDVKFTKHRNIASDSYDLHMISMSNHTGTHIDFPSHIITEGPTSNSYPLSHLCGEGIVLSISNSIEEKISKLDLTELDIRANDILLLKYTNKLVSRHAFPCLDDDAADYLINKKIKIIGTEGLSIDSLDDKKLRLHKKFLSNNILIVEDLDMKICRPGRVQVYIFPLKLKELDGAPCRVGVTYT